MSVDQAEGGQLIQVAVYGTLRRGSHNHHLMGRARFLETLWLAGFDLFSLGSYPAAVSGQGKIKVELYEVDQDTLRLLDQLEDYDPEQLEQSEYVRVELNCGSGRFFIYLYNQPLNGAALVASGDWLYD